MYRPTEGWWPPPSSFANLQPEYVAGLSAEFRYPKDEGGFRHRGGVTPPSRDVPEPSTGLILLGGIVLTLMAKVWQRMVYMLRQKR